MPQAHIEPPSTSSRAAEQVRAPTPEHPYWHLPESFERLDLAVVLARVEENERAAIEQAHSDAVGSIARAAAALDLRTQFLQRRGLCAAIASLAHELGGIRPGYTPAR